MASYKSIYKTMAIAAICGLCSSFFAQAEAKITLPKNGKFIESHMNYREDQPQVESFTVYYENTLQRPVPYEEKALRWGKNLLIPLALYEKVTPYQLEDIKGGKQIRLPLGRIHKDKILFDTYGAAEVVKLPVVRYEGVDYVNMGSSPYLGVVLDQVKKQSVLRAYHQDIKVPQRAELETPLTWVFDPIMTYEPYQRLGVKGSSTIISPSWFELTKTGLQVSSKMTGNYMLTYGDRDFHVWPLITNQFDEVLTGHILKNRRLWETYRNQLIAYALLYGFDGYNFDFENINYEDREKLTEFITYLSDELRPYGIYSSADVTGYSNSENWSLVYDRKGIGKAVDYVVLMAYDETWAASKVAGPVASYPWVKRNLETFLEEVPKEKAILGVPFYMRQWAVPVKGNWEGKAKGKTLAMEKAEAIAKEFSDVVTWNEELQLHYVELNMRGDQLSTPTKSPYEGDRLKIWFEDTKSLREKLNLVHTYQLGGFAAWRKGFETEAVWTMIEEEYPKASESTAREHKNKKKSSKEAWRDERKKKREEAKQLKVKKNQAQTEVKKDKKSPHKVEEKRKSLLERIQEAKGDDK